MTRSTHFDQKVVEKINLKIKNLFKAYLHNDVVNGDVDELDEEPNKAHDCKTNRCCHGNLLKLCKDKNYTLFRCITAFLLLPVQDIRI